ncbi:hypothetical protein HJG60_011648 [Phyllostomus discolor]|uniref:Uncharacterized protein n=1 Tax=Phyllostomus discolor TaxID=89673 RepID=A0A833ZW81_9CHIR|nr:hypothetical protein HJG60_011648 [Phyllostomus discolor]
MTSASHGQRERASRGQGPQALWLVWPRPGLPGCVLSAAPARVAASTGTLTGTASRTGSPAQAGRRPTAFLGGRGGGAPEPPGSSSHALRPPAPGELSPTEERNFSCGQQGPCTHRAHKGPRRSPGPRSSRGLPPPPAHPLRHSSLPRRSRALTQPGGRGGKARLRVPAELGVPVSDAWTQQHVTHRPLLTPVCHLRTPTKGGGAGPH